MNTFPRTSLLLIFLTVVGADDAKSEVCYGDLGCFSLKAPWHSTLRSLPPPQSPVDIDTQFHLYTRSRSEKHTVLKTGTVYKTSDAYDGEIRTIFIVHGFLTNSDDRWVLEMKDALLKEFDANIILVDWKQEGWTQLNYLQAVANARIVGAELAQFAKFLVTAMGASVARFHLIGHSLGSHIAGYVGKALPGIAKITALDAAQPAFDGYPALVRLDKGDALFVEALHTNARPFFPFLGYGYMEPIGHIDYYLNGGANQPGCSTPSLENLGSLMFKGVSAWAACAHNRAHEVFTASIHNKECTIWGHKRKYSELSSSIQSDGMIELDLKVRDCRRDTCSPLGLHSSDYPARGVFLVKTTGTYPYCIAEPTNDALMAKYKTSEFTS